MIGSSSLPVMTGLTGREFSRRLQHSPLDTRPASCYSDLAEVVLMRDHCHTSFSDSISAAVKGSTMWSVVDLRRLWSATTLPAGYGPARRGSDADQLRSDGTGTEYGKTTQRKLSGTIAIVERQPKGHPSLTAHPSVPRIHGGSTRNRNAACEVAPERNCNHGPCKGFRVPWDRRNWMKEHPNSKRSRYYRKTYGLTFRQYVEKAKKQGGKCDICGTPSTITSHRGARGVPKKPNLHVDHDHVTGLVRGLLCSQCNTGIGFLKESVEVMKAAIAYIEKHAGPDSD